MLIAYVLLTIFVGTLELQAGRPGMATLVVVVNVTMFALGVWSSRS